MPISNHDIDSILNQLFRNDLGVNNRDSIFTTDENASNRRQENVRINIESIMMLLSELYSRTNSSGHSVTGRVSSEEATRNVSPLPHSVLK